MSADSRVSIRASRDNYRFDKVAIHLFTVDSFGEINGTVRRPLGFETVDEAVCINPSAQIDKDQAQQLMNDLWEIGVRPDERHFREDKGALAATKDHLKDMRELVFDWLPAITTNKETAHE